MVQRHAEVGLVVLYFLCMTCPLTAEQVTVGGKVLGPEKQPVADCRVLAFYYTPDRQWETAEAVSDATGVFSFTLDVWDTVRYVNVVAVKQGLAPDWGHVNDGEEATLRLAANPVTCTGTVVDSEGNPIAGAEVSVLTLRRPNETDASRQYLSLREESFLSDTTDEEGRFEITDLPPGAQVGLTVAAEGWARLTCRARSISERGLRFVLKPEATISGRVTHAGQPVAGVKVLCYGQGPYSGRAEGVSAEDGTYTLNQLPFGFYILRVEPPEELTVKVGERIEVNPGEHVTGVEVELTRGGVVQGTVTEAETGRLIAGVRMGAQNLFRSVTTSEAGTYSIRLPAGKTKVYCSGGGSPPMEPVESREREVEVEVVEGDTVTGIDFVLRERQPVMLRGQVLLPDGQPAVGVQIGIVGGYWGPSGADPFKTRTDAEGKFELEVGQRVSPPGYQASWTVIARQPDQGLIGMVTAHNAKDPVELRLAHGGYVVAEVVDTEGKPVPDVGVRVYVSVSRDGRRTRTSLPGQASSDEQGHIRTGPLPSGVPLMVQPAEATELLVVDDAWRQVGEITLTPGEERELPILRLDLEGRSVRGWVGDQQQRPVAGAIVYGTGEWQYTESQEPVYADERGYFELSGLPMQGKVTIVALHPTKPLFASEQLDPDWGLRPGLLLRPTGSVIGQVLDDREQPVYDATVSVQGGLVMGYRMSEELRWRLAEAGFVQQTHTDREGKWSAEGLIAGVEYQIYARAPDQGSAYASNHVTVEPGQTVNLGEMVLKQRQQ